MMVWKRTFVFLNSEPSNIKQSYSWSREGRLRKYGLLRLWGHFHSKPQWYRAPGGPTYIVDNINDILWSITPGQLQPFPWPQCEWCSQELDKRRLWNHVTLSFLKVSLKLVSSWNETEKFHRFFAISAFLTQEEVDLYGPQSLWNHRNCFTSSLLKPSTLWEKNPEAGNITVLIKG